MTRWRLSTVEFTVLWRRMELGDTPLLLDVPEHSRTLEQRDRQDAQAWEELRARRLVDSHGPRAELAGTLSALARPAVEADLRMVTGPAQRVRVLACATNLVGVVAVPGTDTVELQPIRPAELAQALLAHVPEHRAAAGDAVSIPVELVQGAGLRADTDLARLQHAGLGADAVRRVRHLLTGPMVRRFKIGAAARDRLGRRHRAPDVVSVLDTEQGRVQIRRQPLPDSDHLLIVPIDHRHLCDQVAELLETAARTPAPDLRRR